MTNTQSDSGKQSVDFWEIYTEMEVIESIKSSPKAYDIYENLSEERKREILLFMQGQKGIKMHYDPFFRHIFDSEKHPERLEDFLSAILDQQVKIKEVMRREGEQLSSEGSFVILDVIVQLADGSYVDVEMQKVGYAFPGERTSCYTSDLIMRQYNRVKKKLGSSFSYKEMKKVYIVVLLEKSTKEFIACKPHYIHERQVLYTSGAQVEELSDIRYISLDTFREVVQNIDNKLHAWLTYLSTDEPAKMMELIKHYPQFAEYYKEIDSFRTKPEELMYMFSEALRIMDRNTELYMIQELQEQVEEIKDELKTKKLELKMQEDQLKTQEDQLKTQEIQIEKQALEVQILRDHVQGLTKEEISAKEKVSLAYINQVLYFDLED